MRSSVLIAGAFAVAAQAQTVTVTSTDYDCTVTAAPAISGAAANGGNYVNFGTGNTNYLSSVCIQCTETTIYTAVFGDYGSDGPYNATYTITEPCDMTGLPQPANVVPSGFTTTTKECGCMESTSGIVITPTAVPVPGAPSTTLAYEVAPSAPVIAVPPTGSPIVVGSAAGLSASLITVGLGLVAFFL